MTKVQLIWILGFSFAILGGHWAVGRVNKERNKVDVVVGIIERALYILLCYFGEYPTMGGFFLILTVRKLVASVDLEAAKKEGRSAWKEIWKVFRLVLACNLVSLLFSVLGVVIIKLLEKK